MDRGQLGQLTTSRVDRAGGQPDRGMGSFSRKDGTKPIYGPHTLTEDYQAHRDSSHQARLYEESVGFPNLANDRFVQEQARYAVNTGLKGVFHTMEFLRNKWLVLYRLYRGELVPDVDYGNLPIHSPEPYKIVETLHPRLMRTLFGAEQWFKLYGEEAEHDENTKAQEALCRHQFRVMKHYDKASRFVRDGLIYGTAIQKTYWKQERREMRYRKVKRKPHPTIPGATVATLEEVQNLELTFDGNNVENVPIFDFLAPPNASSIDDAEWCADRSMWPDYKVKEMGELGHWRNLEALRDHPGSKDSFFGDEFKQRKAYAYGVFDPHQASRAPHIPHYEVIDWWGPLVVRKENGSYETKMCNVVMIDPNGAQIIARVTEIPFWHGQKPYQAWRPIDLEDEFYGIGAIEMIARLSREKDVKRQLLMAATQLEANPMWLISDEANIPDGQLVLQPGLTLRVPSIQDSVAPLHVPKVSDAALKAESVLTMDIRETAGTTSPSMGAQDPFGKSKTATQHTSEVDMTNLRVSDLVANYERQVIVPMLDQMTWNNQQFASYSKTIRDVGSVGVSFRDRWTVTPEDLIGRFIVQPLASYRLLTKQTIVQQLTNLLDRGPIINQMYGPHAVNLPKLLAYILEHGFDVRNADEFVSVPDDDSSLLTPMEEHELWYHGKVPPRRRDDNDLRHAMMHLQELGEERFGELDKGDPQLGAKVRAHIAEHFRKLALQQDRQEFRLQQFAQVAAEQGIQIPPGVDGIDAQGVSIPGAASPDQDPTSPKVRTNEVERGDSPGGQSDRPGADQQSDAMRQAPNLGAS